MNAEERREHYKKLVHWRESGAILDWKLNCGYKDYCVKTTKIKEKVTCPKCLDLTKQG